MKSKEEIEEVIHEIESHVLCDKKYREMKKFPFYAEVNLDLTTLQGIRRVLLWVINKRSNNPISIEGIGKPGG